LSDGQDHSIQSAENALGYSRRQISDAAALLRRRGYLAAKKTGVYCLNEGGRAAVTNKVPITSGPIGPTGAARYTDTSFRARSWRAMRLRRHFTIDEIVGDAVCSERHPQSNLARYFRALIAVGYLAEMPRRRRGTKQESNGFKQYSLVKDTGPRAPGYSRTRKILHDFNLGKDIPCVAN
jgi:hypothetical protein